MLDLRCECCCCSPQDLHQWRLAGVAERSASRLQAVHSHQAPSPSPSRKTCELRMGSLVLV